MIVKVLTQPKDPRPVMVNSPENKQKGSEMSSEQNKNSKLQDHRDFPRLHVEAKVRIAGTATSADSEDQPAIISDLSLGGTRLSSPATLKQGEFIGLIPFNGLLDDHPLHRVLDFEVRWCKPSSSEDGEWYEYGLIHHGSVLDILNSWLGHLLLRRRSASEVGMQRREHRRVSLKEPAPEVKARLSHNSLSFDLTLLDIAPGGLLARSESDQIPVGVHLELESNWADTEEEEEWSGLFGCVVDAHSQSGSTFYRVAFDPDSEFDEEQLINWAESLGEL